MINTKNVTLCAKECVQILCESCLDLLGPQRSFTSIINDEKCVPSKSIEKLNILSYHSNNPFLKILSQQFNDFEKVHKTGTSTLIALTTFLLQHMEPIHPSPIELSSALDSFVEIFTSICDSLCIHPQSHSNQVYPSTQTHPLTHILTLTPAAHSPNNVHNHISNDTSSTERTYSSNERVQNCLSVDISFDDPDDINWFFDSTIDFNSSPNTTNFKTDNNSEKQIYNINNVFTNNLAVSDELSSESAPVSQSGTRAQPSMASEVWTDLWLARGLQHCFPWEYFDTSVAGVGSSLCHSNVSPSSVPSKLTWRSNSEGVGLPMRLAVEAASNMWGVRSESELDPESEHKFGSEFHTQHGHGHGIGRKATKSLASAAMQHLQTTRASDVSDDRSHTLSLDETLLPLYRLQVEAVTGVSSAHSAVYTATVAFSCSCKAWRYATHALSHHPHPLSPSPNADSRFNNNKQMRIGPQNTIIKPKFSITDTTNMVSSQPLVFEFESNLCGAVLLASRVMLVDGSLFAGDTGEGGGESPQAVANNRLWLHRLVPTMSPEDLYLQRVLSTLKELGVQLLLVNQSLREDRMEDACAAAGIAVMSIPQRSMWAVSSLCDAKILEDVLDAEPEDIGDVDVRLTCVSRGAHILQERVDDDLGVADDELTVLLSINSADMDRTSVNSNQPSFSTSDCSEKIYYQDDNIGKSNSMHRDRGRGRGDDKVTTVVLSSPASVGTNDIQLRLTRCVHRLRSAIISGVVPGAGLPQILCALELRQCSLDSSSSSHSPLSLKPVFDAIADALEAYILRVALNCGLSWADATCRLTLVKKMLIEQYRCWSDHEKCCASLQITELGKEAVGLVASTTILDWLLSLSLEQKLSLPSPIDVSDNDSHVEDVDIDICNNSAATVLDAVGVVKEAVRAASHAVRSVLSCGAFVTKY